MLHKEINAYQTETAGLKPAFMPSQTPVIQSPAYYPPLDRNQRLRNLIAPAVEPYVLDKQFPMPRSDMYSYEHYQNHLRPAYDPYPYYHHLNVSTTGTVVENEKKPKRGSKSKEVAKPAEVEDEEEKKKRFLERNRLAASKCRQKRKALTQELELRSSELFQKNRELKMEINMLQLENEKLKERLQQYEKYPTEQQ